VTPFNADFYVASVAAAPVIALAALLSVSDALDRKVSLTMRRRQLEEHPPKDPDAGELLEASNRANQRSNLMAAVNAAIQASAFTIGMVSLSQQHDFFVPRMLVAIAQSIGFFLLLEGTTTAAWARHMVFHLDHDVSPDAGSEDEAAPAT
jgi:hypothetical protein